MFDVENIECVWERDIDELLREVNELKLLQVKKICGG